MEKIIPDPAIAIRLANTLDDMEVMHSKYPRPPANENHVRLYGHVLCPYVEKVRLVLCAKRIQY